jgi:hypothetical protein
VDKLHGLRVTHRNEKKPSQRIFEAGFRCALDCIKGWQGM